ncbi:YczE/YyaS/YitT family protein [Deinococcus marmoris]|uniref:Integral membrane protein n=1 Tax=Deinococcus marmoris TaxID=249408 RepID=A0A1U7P419_9DEIO|nr:YitT family protein [Deinococcus marmoris]OLV19912.1 integral membrane protein [Deinococcus marmoris]
MTASAPLARLVRPSRLARFVLLLTGLFLYGLSLRMMLDANVGTAPWEVLHVGVTRHLPLTVGVVSILTGAVIVTFTALRLKERIGLGTVLNVVLIGVFLDLLAPLIPNPVALGWRWAQFLLGVGLLGFATGAYVAAGLGAGPRDGLTLALNRLSGWPVPRIRSAVEVAVLLVGWALGGPLGWGTLVFALTVGPAMGWGLGLFGVGKKA